MNETTVTNARKPHKRNTGPQTIFRENTGQFSQIPNAIIAAQDMSYAAKGVLTYLLSKPDDWILRPADIEKHGTGGQHAIRAALLELRALGYLKLDKVTRAGIIREWQWTIADHRRFTQKPDCVIPLVDNQHSTHTDSTKKHPPEKPPSLAQQKAREAWYRREVALRDSPMERDGELETYAKTGLATVPDSQPQAHDPILHAAWLKGIALGNAAIAERKARPPHPQQPETPRVRFTIEPIPLECVAF